MEKQAEPHGSPPFSFRNMLKSSGETLEIMTTHYSAFQTRKCLSNALKCGRIEVSKHTPTQTGGMMMTIRKSIEKWWLEALYDRQEKLAEIGVPDVVLTANMNAIRKVEDGELKIGTGSKEAEQMLDEELTGWEELRGNGGKWYYRFNGKLNFFPQAKYGLYVAIAEQKGATA